MFTQLSLWVGALLASKGFATAKAALPYVEKCTPYAVLALAATVGYLHGDVVARVCLGLVAVNEFLAVRGK